MSVIQRNINVFTYANNIIKKLNITKLLKKRQRSALLKRTYCYTNLYTEKNNHYSYSGVFSQDEYCSYCKGKKIIKCMECKGCGRIYYDGMKEYICDMCCGCGHITCNFCGGTGINHMI